MSRYTFRVEKVVFETMPPTALPTRERSVERRDWTMTAGDPCDPLVVLLHGAGANAEVWEDHLQVLSDDYRVVAVDLPGHRNHPAETFTFERAIASVRTVIADEDGPVILVGHSVGGYVTSKFVEEHPDVVDAIVTSGSYMNFRHGKGLLVGILFAYAFAPVVRLAEYSGFWKDVVVDRLSNDDYEAESFSRDTVQGAATAMKAIGFADVWTGIEQFDGPVLVGAGEDEPFVEDYGPAFADRAGATFEYMPFDGHNGPITHPESFTEVVERFVRERNVIPG